MKTINFDDYVDAVKTEMGYGSLTFKGYMIGKLRQYYRQQWTFKQAEKQMTMLSSQILRRKADAVQDMKDYRKKQRGGHVD